MKKNVKNKRKEKEVIICNSVLELFSALGLEDGNTYLYYDNDCLLAFDKEKHTIREVDNYEEAQSF